jgi:Type VI secretion system/phage-baseplate injector OB domain
MTMSQFPGVYIGTITGNVDPNQQGRLQVSVPSVAPGAMWAPACLSASGARVGGQAVVAFEAADATRPIVIGFLG